MTHDDANLRDAVRALEAGFLVVFPTDTVYGVAADPRVPGARERLYAAKKREAGKPIPVLVTGAEVAVRLGAVMSATAGKLAARYWPGALTLVLPVGAASEGFRVPDHPVALALLEAAGGALLVTSANPSGLPPAKSAKEAVEALAPHVKVGLDGGPAPCGRESTVVRVDGDKVSVLREGAVSRKDIESCAAGL